MTKAEDKTAAVLRQLARDVELIGQRVNLIADDLGSAKESAAGAHRAVARLAKAVDALSAESEPLDGSDSAEPEPEVGPWLTIDDPDAARATLAELVEWLAAVYVRYPGGQLGGCWPWHASVI